MNNNPPANQTIKLQPKAIYSSDYHERENLRVAAYIRVSTDSAEQQTSFDTQHNKPPKKVQNIPVYKI